MKAYRGIGGVQIGSCRRTLRQNSLLEGWQLQRVEGAVWLVANPSIGLNACTDKHHDEEDCGNKEAEVVEIDAN